MASSVWSGHISFGIVSIPVRLHAGARSTSISFNMLHRTDNSRLKQQYICQADGQVVGREDTVKGYEYRKGEYITILPEEITAIQPQSSREMQISEFVKASEVDALYYESSYYVLPEEAGRKAYTLLVKGMESSQYVAISKISMHNREYTVFLRPHEGGLVLHTMYYQDEIRRPEGFGSVDIEVKDAEVKMVNQIIDSMSEDWDPSKFEDSFQTNLKKMIEAKLNGEEITPTAPAPKAAPVVDLMAALKASLAQMEAAKATKQAKPAVDKKKKKVA
jgi:DNA end-binding protein Ku